MPSRHFFKLLSCSYSSKRKSRTQLAREKAEIDSVFAPSFPNGLPEPYLWKASHRNRRASKNNGSFPKGDSKYAKGEFTNQESAFKMGNMFEGLTNVSEFTISVKDPSLAFNINDASGSKQSSLDLDVIESVEDPLLVLEVRNGFSNGYHPGDEKAQAHEQQVESSPAFLTIPPAGRSKTPSLPKRSPNSHLIGIAERPKERCSKAVEAIGTSTDPDHLERSKFPSGKHSRMRNYLERTKVAIRAKPASVRNSALVRSAASLRHSASHRSRYATQLPMNGGYRLYRRPRLPGTASLAPRPIPQIIITPPPPEERDSSTNAEFDFNSPPSPSPSPSTTGPTAEVPVSEAQTPAEEEEEGESFGQKMARLLESHIDNAQIRNELTREICKVFAEEEGTTVGISARSS